MRFCTVRHWLKSRRLYASIVLSVVAALVVAACGGGDPTSTPRPAATATPRAAATATPVPATPTPDVDAPKRGGILEHGRFGGSHGIETLDGVPGGRGAQRNNIGPWVYSALMLFDAWDDNKLKGDLAESWQFDPSGTQLTLRLRDARWHNGQPVTGQDVANALTVHTSPPEGRLPTQMGRAIGASMQAATAIDARTVSVTLASQDATFLQALALDGDAAIFPAGISLEELEKNPIGSGPWKLERIQRDAFTEFVRNDDFYRTDANGQAIPFMDGVTMRQFGDGALMVAAYRSGRIDMIFGHNGIFVNPLIDEITRDVPGSIFTPHVTGPFSYNFTNKPPFDDIRVRQAVSIWFDRVALADVAWGGIATFYNAGVIPQEVGGQWGLPPGEIMSTPGYRYLDADGNLVDSLEKLVAKRDELVKDPADRQKALDLLAEAGIGQGDVKLTLKIFPFDTRGGEVALTDIGLLFGTKWEGLQQDRASYGTDRAQGNFEVMWSIAGTYSWDDIVGIRRAWVSDEANLQVQGFPPDERLDALYREAATTLDTAQRRAVMWEFQREILNKAYNVLGGSLLFNDVRGPQVKNDYVRVGSSGYWKSNTELWLDRG